MTIHLHVLKGCSPVPLAHYLKALGILRLVGEQADKQARGWWEGEYFCLLTQLSKEELEMFFLERYEPTPLLSPWNGGSGFFRTWDAKNNRLRNNKNADALEDLLATQSDRLLPLSQAVEEIRQLLPLYCSRVDVAKLSSKERNKLLILPAGEGPVFPVITKDEAGKTLVQQVLIRQSRSSAYYRSCLVDVEEEIKCPSLWGTGGNDGNIDYTGRFFENLKQVLMPADLQLNVKLLSNSLFAANSTGFLSKAAGKVGQFLPSGAGGANVTTGHGTQQDTYLNPWDFVLSLEGAVLFRTSATRRLDPNAQSRASSPFVVKSQAAGFGTASAKVKRNELEDLRGEQWMPLWNQPATLADIVALFGEGRLQLNTHTSDRPVDVIRAISRLGVARGTTAFVRLGYMKRNGKSMLAVPLGRINVRENRLSHLIDDLAPWMNRLQRYCRNEKKQSPERLVHAERRLADAVFAVLTHDYTPDRWQAILLATADVEALQATGTAIEAGPIPSLRPEWAAAVDDGSAEVRLALALGSAAADYFKGRAIDAVRPHWLPLEPKRWPPRFKTTDKRLVNDPRVVTSGRDPIRDLSALVERRLIEAGMKGQRRSRLVAAAGCGARLDDLARFLSGSLDLDKLLGLARAFMAIKWDQWARVHNLRAASSTEVPEECWLAVRLACLSWPLTRDMDIPADLRIVRLLSGAEGSRAIEIARTRLRSVGIRPPLQAGVTDPASARLWAAALAFPINRGSALRAAAILDPSMKGLLHA
jgi:CRISPR-associated protein Csx17